MKDKLSIVTICYNEVERIEATLRSVISQSFQDFQYIVVDGASIDGTVSILERYKNYIDVLVSEADNGIYNAMNKAIDFCEGEYVYFLNGGDVLYQNDTLMNIFMHKLEGDLIYGNICIKEQSGERRILKMPETLTKPFLLQKTIPHQATFTRRNLFELLGKYDESYQIAADYKFSLQAIYQLKCKLQYVPETFAIFDRSGVGFLNPEKRNKEKKEIQDCIFFEKSDTFYQMLKKYFPF